MYIPWKVLLLFQLLRNSSNGAVPLHITTILQDIVQILLFDPKLYSQTWSAAPVYSLINYLQ